MSQGGDWIGEGSRIVCRQSVEGRLKIHDGRDILGQQAVAESGVQVGGRQSGKAP